MRDIAEFDSMLGYTQIVNHIAYDAFGGVTSETNAAVDTIFGFTGRETDAESDLYYYRARYYDPRVGRFTSEDPLGFAAGDVNLYRYVGNGPTGAVDPSGLEGTGFPVLLTGGWFFGKDGRHPVHRLWIGYHRIVQENNANRAARTTRLSQLYLVSQSGDIKAVFFVEKLKYVSVPPCEGKWYQTEGAKAWR